jgi:hypothetical protein
MIGIKRNADLSIAASRFSIDNDLSCGASQTTAYDWTSTSGRNHAKADNMISSPS